MPCEELVFERELIQRLKPSRAVKRCSRCAMAATVIFRL